MRISWSILLFLPLAFVAVSRGPISMADDADTQSARYYPLTVGNEYYYKAAKTSNPDREYRVRAEIKKIKSVDGKDYFYLFAPDAGVRYLVRRDDTGVFMRLLKRDIPLFGMSLNVHLDPELKFLRFPLTVGDQWSQQVNAKAKFLFIPIRRTIEGKFHIVDKQILHTEAGDIETFVVNARLGVVDGTAATKTFWYGKDVGYVKADTPEDFMVIVGYRILDEQTGAWIDKKPTNAGQYK